MKIPFYRKLTEEQKKKIEKFGAWMFFLSAVIFVIPLFLFYFSITQSAKTSGSGAGGAVIGYIIIMSFPAIVSLFFAVMGLIASILTFSKKLLFILFLFLVPVFLFVSGIYGGIFPHFFILLSVFLISYLLASILMLLFCCFLKR